MKWRKKVDCCNDIFYTTTRRASIKNDLFGCYTPIHKRVNNLESRVVPEAFNLCVHCAIHLASAVFRSRAQLGNFSCVTLEE
eukprot:455830-Amphidinium_carterae.1